jgi:hypothetical protein
MKAIEIVESIKTENPALLGKMPNAKAVKIIKAALVQIGKHIDAEKEGKVKVPGVGKFIIRQVEREKGGQKKTVKTIAFRAAKKKVKPLDNV